MLSTIKVLPLFSVPPSQLTLISTLAGSWSWEAKKLTGLLEGTFLQDPQRKPSRPGPRHVDVMAEPVWVCGKLAQLLLAVYLLGG